MKYRKTNGELGREELSFQLGEMGEFSCSRVCLLSVSIVWGASIVQLELGWQHMVSGGERTFSP